MPDTEASQTELRIVHNVSSLAQEASGPSYSVVRLCESLIGQGDACRLLTLDWAPDTTYPPFASAFSMGLGPRRLGRSPAMHRWLDAQARAGAIDLIHTHGLWMMTNVYPGWVARRRHVPLVVSPRGTFTRYAMASGSRIKALFWPLAQRPALSPTVCFHATGEAEYNDIRRLGFRQPVALIANGVDLPNLMQRHRGNRRTLLFLARIHPNKGLDMLLPAWDRLQGRFPDWDLRIVGSDHGYHGVSGHLNEMKALSVRLGLNRVTFDGALFGEDKFRAFRNADLYVLPTYSENFGMTVAEALSQEVPVIVTKGAPWQDVERNNAGWWIDIGLEPMTISLERAMSQPRHHLDAMGVSGRNWMQRDFLWQQIAKDMSDSYRWLLNQSLPQPTVIRLD